MWLRYEVKEDKNGEEYCVTPCPLGKKTMGIARIMIGSENCPHCKLYGGQDDLVNQVMSCNCQKKMTKEQVEALINEGKAFL